MINRFVTKFNTMYKYSGIKSPRDCARKFKEARRDVKKYHRDYDLKVRYGITPEHYNELFEAQKGCCKICGRHQSELKKTLHIDHDHKTGYVRGLLCRGCNHGLGNFTDNPELLRQAIKYLTFISK